MASTAESTRIAKTNKKRQRKAPPDLRQALSLFSGAGGMDIGVKQAGFDVKACIELDKHCCSTLRHNLERQHAQTTVVEGDIRSFDPLQLAHDLRIEPGTLDLLFGGPPCQAFSQIGKQKALNDDRGVLLFQMTRFAEALRPKAILIEQVKGLLSAKDSRGIRGGVLELLLKRLTELGYVPKWTVLNAADYGVPQKRQRLFIVALREPNGFSFPAPQFASAKDTSLLFRLPQHRNVGEVLSDLPDPVAKGCPATISNHVDITPDGDKRRIGYVPEGDHLARQHSAPRDVVGNLSKKDTTKFLRLSRWQPANTLRCGEVFFHPLQQRYLTPREYMRIHGYPDEYELVGPIRGRTGRVKNLDQHRQIANSVPPPLAKVIASEILKVLNARNI